MEDLSRLILSLVYSVVGLIVKSGEERFFVLCKRFILVHGNLFIFLALG